MERTPNSKDIEDTRVHEHTFLVLLLLLLLAFVSYNPPFSAIFTARCCPRCLWFRRELNWYKSFLVNMCISSHFISFVTNHRTRFSLFQTFRPLQASVSLHLSCHLTTTWLLLADSSPFQYLSELFLIFSLHLLWWWLWRVRLLLYICWIHFL